MLQALSRTFSHLGRLEPMDRTGLSRRRNFTVKYFRTAKPFDTDKGIGLIKPETGGDDLNYHGR